MRSMLVIGLGRFGENLAKRLTELGNEVMVVDRNEESIEKIAPFVTSAIVGDCMDPDVIDTIGVNNFDVCFVCISDEFQSSLEITSLLKDAGAKHVVSKTDRDIHAKFLLRIGADEVIHPERDMAQRAAIKYTVGNVLNYFELSKEYAIFEIVTPKKWAGKSILELNIRNKYHMNIIGMRDGENIKPIIDAKYVFTGEEQLVIAGSREDSIKLLNTNN